MKITKQSILLAVLVIGVSFQLFLPVGNSLLVQQVQAADLVGTQWSGQYGLYILEFEKKGKVSLVISQASSQHLDDEELIEPIRLKGQYSEKENVVTIDFPKDNPDLRISGTINGETMKIKFNIKGKTKDYEFIKVKIK